MRTLVYAMADEPWQLVVQCLQAGLLRANILYYSGNTAGHSSLRPDSVGQSVTVWSFPGAPTVTMSDLNQNDVPVALNADGGSGTAELLYLELQHWEDPFNNSGEALVRIDVQQGGVSRQLTEVTIAPNGAPQTNVQDGPYEFTTPVAWREAALYFDWRTA